MTRSLDPDERLRYEWQLEVPGFGEEGQLRLRESTVLVTRVGGLGGTVAYHLAAAGIGRLVIAHAGEIRLDDLNRQLLMTHEALGTSRVACAARRLQELDPRLEVVPVAENVTSTNVGGLVSQVDVVVDAAPLFEERFALNRAAVQQRKPLVECAMYGLEATLTSVLPGETPCLACLYPEAPSTWRRRFPVFGAVSGSVAALAAGEVIKILTGIGEPLRGRLLRYDLRDMAFQTLRVRRRSDCEVCGAI